MLFSYTILSAFVTTGIQGMDKRTQKDSTEKMSDY